MFICWGIFALTITIVCSLVAVWIITNEDLKESDENSLKAPSHDTVYVIVKSEVNEIRMSSYSVNKDSVWIAPISSKVTIKESIK